MTRQIRLVAGAGLAVLVVAVFAACGVQVDRYEVAYDTVFQARAEEAVDREWVPEWLPEEATDIRALHDTNGSGALLAADLAASATPDPCAPASSVADPTLSADWFPADAATRGSLLQCDDWVGVHDGGRLLLWRP